MAFGDKARLRRSATVSTFFGGVQLARLWSQHSLSTAFHTNGRPHSLFLRDGLKFSILSLSSRAPCSRAAARPTGRQCAIELGALNCLHAIQSTVRPNPRRALNHAAIGVLAQHEALATVRPVPGTLGTYRYIARLTQGRVRTTWLAESCSAKVACADGIKIYLMYLAGTVPRFDPSTSLPKVVTRHGTGTSCVFPTEI